jgi:hypothetical protein
MVTYDYTGVVEVIGETKAFGANGFTKRELVVGNDVDSPNKYPNPVLFTFKKERCSLVDAVKQGDRVKVQFTIDGRRWDGPNGTRYFTDLTGWKIDVLNADGTATEPVPVPQPAEAPADVDAGDPDDLPF